MDTFDCILAIAEHKNISRAAEAVFMTQPALTLRLNRYETELGVKLFDRSKSPVRITREGEYYIQEMSQIRIAEEKMRSHLHGMASETEQSITLGIGFNRGSYWLPDLLPRLMAEFPDCDFQIREASDRELEKLVKQGDVDIGIIGSPVFSSEISVRKLGVEKLFLAVPRQNRIFQNEENVEMYSVMNPFVITDHKVLLHQTFVVGSNSYGFSRIMNSIFDAFRIQPEKTLNVGNTTTSYHLSAGGLGISIMSQAMENMPVPSNVCRPVPCVVEGISLDRSVNLILKSANREEMLYNRIIDSIVNWMRESL